MPRTTPTTPRCKLKWRRSKPSSSPTSDLPHLREDAQEHMPPSYHLRQGHIGIDTITNKNVKVKSSTPTTAQRLHHLPWHLLQETSWHLRPQAPQEKLPKLKSATSTSYYDLDIDHEIPFYGTLEPEEYLEWERLMDDYLKLHQVPPEDQVKCATRNFHDYASTWWLHTPSENYDMS